MRNRVIFKKELTGNKNAKSDEFNLLLQYYPKESSDYC